MDGGYLLRLLLCAVLRTVELPDFSLEERMASCLTSSENLSAPVAREASARLVVFAATEPNAAASFRPEAKAWRATCSAALIASGDPELPTPLFALSSTSLRELDRLALREVFG